MSPKQPTSTLKRSHSAHAAPFKRTASLAKQLTTKRGRAKSLIAAARSVPKIFGTVGRSSFSASKGIGSPGLTPQTSLITLAPPVDLPEVNVKERCLKLLNEARDAARDNAQAITFQLANMADGINHSAQTSEESAPEGYSSTVVNPLKEKRASLEAQVRELDKLIDWADLNSADVENDARLSSAIRQLENSRSASDQEALIVILRDARKIDLEATFGKVVPRAQAQAEKPVTSLVGGIAQLTIEPADRFKVHNPLLDNLPLTREAAKDQLERLDDSMSHVERSINYLSQGIGEQHGVNNPYALGCKSTEARYLNKQANRVSHLVKLFEANDPIAAELASQVQSLTDEVAKLNDLLKSLDAEINSLHNNPDQKSKLEAYKLQLQQEAIPKTETALETVTKQLLALLSDKPVN